MYICRDVSREVYISVYWEENQLLIVVKEMQADGSMRQKDAAMLNPVDAEVFMADLCHGRDEVLGKALESLDCIAIAGHIAEGLKGSRVKQLPNSRRQLWN